MDFEPTHSIEMEFKDFLDICREIVDMHMRKLYPRSIFELTRDEQQILVDKINQHIEFEFARKPYLKGAHLEINGYGLMYIAEDIDILGAETISDGDVITGRLDVVCVLPVPTLECVQLGDSKATPIIDETLSVMLMLNEGVYKTGLMHTGEFQLEHDLGEYNIGVPLSHALTPAIV